MKEQIMKQTSPHYQTPSSKEDNKNAEGFEKTTDGNADHCNKELESVKKNQSKLDSSIGEIKTNLEAINSRLNNKEE